MHVESRCIFLLTNNFHLQIRTHLYHCKSFKQLLLVVCQTQKYYLKVSLIWCLRSSLSKCWKLLSAVCQNCVPKKPERDSAKFPFLVAQWLGSILCTLLANSSSKEIKTFPGLFFLNSNFACYNLGSLQRHPLCFSRNGFCLFGHLDPGGASRVRNDKW